MGKKKHTHTHTHTHPNLTININNGSMHDRFTYIWLKFMVNLGKYSIHGCYGYDNLSVSVLGGLKTPRPLWTPRSHPVVLAVVDPAGHIGIMSGIPYTLSDRMHAWHIYPHLISKINQIAGRSNGWKMTFPLLREGT